MTYKPTGRKPGRPQGTGRVQIYAGKVLGHLKIIQKVNSRHSGTTWRVECIAPSGPNGAACGQRLTVRQHYMLRPSHPKTSCGCMTYIGAEKHKRERTIWQMMNRRCLYPTHVSWKYYGALGVRPCDEWIETNPDGWKNFIRDMGPAPTRQHSLERLNPFEGYSLLQSNGERQCIWATATEQANNKRHHYAARMKKVADAQAKATKAAETDGS